MSSEKEQAVTFAWDLSECDGVAVLSLSGSLTLVDSRRLVAAVAWVSAHSSGPLVLDLTGVRAWDGPAGAAVDAAVGGWLKEDRAVALSLPASAARRLQGSLSQVDVYHDLETAVAAVRGVLVRGDVRREVDVAVTEGSDTASRHPEDPSEADRRHNASGDTTTGRRA